MADWGRQLGGGRFPAGAALIALAAMLAAYGLAVCAASLIVGARAGCGVLITLPVIFPVLRLAWGSGFWIGLADQAVSQRHRPRIV